MTVLALGLLVFAAFAVVDYAHTRYVQDVALVEDMHRRREPVGWLLPARASFWSVAQWAAATVGFVVAVRVTLWVLPFEAAGLALGTFLALMRRPKE